MSATENVQVIREVFRAIEERDLARLQELFEPDAEFHWAPSLPYGRSAGLSSEHGPTWAETWIPLQPTEAERSMDLRIVSASDDEVVGLWRQRGVSADGTSLDVPVLALYEVRGGKLARAQMFYFDSAEVGAFLERANA
jgi:ketosteroid isomerase-like protein